MVVFVITLQIRSFAQQNYFSPLYGGIFVSLVAIICASALNYLDEPFYAKSKVIQEKWILTY